MFRDVRARGQLSAAEFQAAGEQIAQNQLPLMTTGDNPTQFSSNFSQQIIDLADYFFAKITVKVRPDGPWQYGFIERVLKPAGTWEDNTGPRITDGVHNWAYTKADVELNVGDEGVLMRRSTYNPDLFEIVTVVGSGSLNVCGAPVAPPLVTGNECPPCGTLDVVTLSSIQGLYFEPCDFQVTATNLCGGTAGSGSGSSGGSASRAARIQLTGKTETVDIPYRLVFCPTDCTILIQYQYECFRRGLYIGRWFDPPVSCGSGSGGSGSGGSGSGGA